ncbi:hypothetical protein AVDCRST_MAG84-6471 [uncultured Microcoleus sp.]|uniref:Uncharacterized protein n=1 Tax=uncultured Microcoleus sp. TaxID=259945 RepID=A0A6J4P754_9CYAN|nr:hypothetical protein AVDCRST_MAG84-6471 [uncultured Microcoleus sp.]
MLKTGFPACSTTYQFSCGVGILPALKGLLIMVQYLSENRL